MVGGIRDNTQTRSQSSDYSEISINENSTNQVSNTTATMKFSNGVSRKVATIEGAIILGVAMVVLFAVGLQGFLIGRSVCSCPNSDTNYNSIFSGQGDQIRSIAGNLLNKASSFIVNNTDDNN